MSLIVHYNTMKKYNAETFKAEERDQADVLGWMLMGTGISEITEKNNSRTFIQSKIYGFQLWQALL